MENIISIQLLIFYLPPSYIIMIFNMIWWSWVILTCFRVSFREQTVEMRWNYSGIFSSYVIQYQSSLNSLPSWDANTAIFISTELPNAALGWHMSIVPITLSHIFLTFLIELKTKEYYSICFRSFQYIFSFEPPNIYG